MDELLEQLEAKKAEIRAFIKEKKADEAERALGEKKNLEKLIKAEKELEEDEKRELLKQKKPKNDVKKNVNEMRALTKQVLGKEKLTDEERETVKTSDNTAVLPKQFINELELIEKGYASLEEYVHVIPVTKDEGTKPIFVPDDTELDDVAEGDAIGKAGLKTQDMKYKCSKVGVINTLSSELLEDAEQDIEYLAREQFTLKAVTTKNVRICNIIKKTAVVVAGASSYKDINNAIDKASPAVKKGLLTFTNTNGFAYLKNLEDKQGRNLNLITEINGKYYFNGKEIVTVDDAIMQNADGKNVFYVCNSKELIKMFKRKEITVAKSEQAGFEDDTIKLRVLARFDIKEGYVRNCFKIEF